ncbi:DNA topoisomerase IB [Sphingobacterium sp. WM]|uniref:DNA topoisomerase IB n=1 Tax=Sphingobacterium sp. WM TaxID=3031802 RepID=UPI00240E8370|nr:DNA topoisomerase IB [Sphingobacterium sp. WM]WFB64916.1 DNA topoisomerase IB [Sphingobacterium sp. WM]
MDKSFTPIPSPNKTGIKYIDSNIAGYSRAKKGKGFSYQDHNHHKITNSKILARIHSLVIPPNWQEVWICPFAEGHIQATGIDDKGRKQYIYHPKWVDNRDEHKFELLSIFGKNLEKLRKQIKKDLNRKDLDCQKVSAIALNIMDLTSMRSGNEYYQKHYGSFGLTTLQNKHLSLENNKISFKYIGKKGVKQEKNIQKKKLAKLLKELSELKGKRLFQYLDDQQKVRPLEAIHLNEYLFQVFKKHITCKTFRTWNACYCCMESLLSENSPTNQKTRLKIIKNVINSAANELGNTKAVVTKHYIHPGIISTYKEGALDSWIMKNRNRSRSMKKKTISDKLLKIISS